MDASEAAVLRNALVDQLKAKGHVRSADVEGALRRVPRHLFVPWLSPEDAYADAAFRDPQSTPETDSSVSQPSAVAIMLEASDVRPGMRVLEVGAGSGYNAALLACLVGERGRVVTVDLESFLVEKARKGLAATGFDRVQVVQGDGALGYPPTAPYDRIVATVGLPDIPLAWPPQLVPGGKIVAPLYVGGAPQDHVLVSLEIRAGYLEGVGLEGLRMVLLRGAAAGHGDASELTGADWRGARLDELRLKIYPRGARVPLEPRQKHLLKKGSLTVLERRAL